MRPATCDRRDEGPPRQQGTNQRQMKTNKRKLRIYLDTSVVSTIDAPHLPDKEAITQEFFRMMAEQPEDFEVVISPVSQEEIRNAPEMIRERSYAVLKSVRAVEIPAKEEADDLSQLYIAAEVLSKKHINDLLHVAYAVLSRCDYIVSWNMKHLVRVWTIERVNAVNFENHYPTIQIVTPEVFTGELPHA
jgi:predicted nucleic acid-binding protein